VNLLKRLFKQTPAGTPPYKILEILPDILSIDVYSHTMPTLLETFPCWTFISRGLFRTGQKEIIISLKKKADENEEDLFEAVVNYYKIITNFAVNKKLVDHGGVTQFGERKFFGHHLLYVEARSIPDIPVPARSLYALLINDEEMTWYQQFGDLRLTAKLGATTRHYPYPSWSDRDRRSVVSEKDREESILSQASLLRNPTVVIFRENNEVVLKLNKAHAAYLREAFAELTPDMPLIFLGRLSPDADACLAWDSSQDEPFAISDPSGQGKKIAGCFLLIATDEGPVTVRVVEDGFGIVMSPENLTGFGQAISSMRPFRMPGKFRLEWV
jgi:hypothetical protein